MNKFQKRSTLYRRCVNVTVGEDEYVFTWVERAGKYNADLAKAEAARREDAKAQINESKRAAAEANLSNDDDDDELSGEEVFFCGSIHLMYSKCISFLFVLFLGWSSTSYHKQNGTQQTSARGRRRRRCQIATS